MKHYKSFIITFILVLFLPIVSACTSKTDTREEKKLNVTTTFFPMYEFTKAVTGKYANVSMIMPSNIEPHDFEPSAKNISQIYDSQLFIYDSKDMESWVDSAKKTVGKKTTFVEASKDIPLNKEDNHNDPHIWLDPVLAKKEVVNIKNAIIKADPKHQDYYITRTNDYLKKLDSLNNKYKKMAKNAKQKTFITQHEAFSYLANEYHLTQKSLTGVNDTEEPSAKQLANIQNYMKQNNLHYIFIEEGLSNKVAKTIKEATHAKLLTLNTLEQVSKKDIDDGATYISLMTENLKELEKALN